jgi:hypothetical protein
MHRPLFSPFFSENIFIVFGKIHQTFGDASMVFGNSHQVFGEFNQTLERASIVFGKNHQT